jgi:hypothetical protein
MLGSPMAQELVSIGAILLQASQDSVLKQSSFGLMIATNWRLEAAWLINYDHQH